MGPIWNWYAPIKNQSGWFMSTLINLTYNLLNFKLNQGCKLGGRDASAKGVQNRMQVHSFKNIFCSFLSKHILNSWIIWDRRKVVAWKLSRRGRLSSLKQPFFQSSSHQRRWFKSPSPDCTEATNIRCPSPESTEAIDWSLSPGSTEVMEIYLSFRRPRVNRPSIKRHVKHLIRVHFSNGKKHFRKEFHISLISPLEHQQKLQKYM